MREQRTKHYHGVTIKSLDDVRRLFAFEASNGLEDRDGDMIDQDGWNLTEYMANPTFLVDHDRRFVFAKTLALWVEQGPTSRALVGEAEALPAGTSARVDAVWQEITFGARRGVSVGFLIEDAEPRTRADGRQGLHITRAKLLEISSVAIPSCAGCLIQQKAGPLGRPSREPLGLDRGTLARLIHQQIERSVGDTMPIFQAHQKRLCSA